jgi:hypothetical protein
MNLPRVISGALLMLASASGFAFDFKSVGAAPAILYDAPSIKGGKLYVAPPGMPVEVVLSYGEWVKVRDISGDMAWTEAKIAQRQAQRDRAQSERQDPRQRRRGGADRHDGRQGRAARTGRSASEPLAQSAPQGRHRRLHQGGGRLGHLIRLPLGFHAK